MNLLYGVTRPPTNLLPKRVASRSQPYRTVQGLASPLVRASIDYVDPYFSNKAAPSPNHVHGVTIGHGPRAAASDDMRFLPY